MDLAGPELRRDIAAEIGVPMPGLASPERPLPGRAGYGRQVPRRMACSMIRGLHMYPVSGRPRWYLWQQRRTRCRLNRSSWSDWSSASLVPGPRSADCTGAHPAPMHGTAGSTEADAGVVPAASAAPAKITNANTDCFMVRRYPIVVSAHGCGDRADRHTRIWVFERPATSLTRHQKCGDQPCRAASAGRRPDERNLAASHPASRRRPIPDRISNSS